MSPKHITDGITIRPLGVDTLLMNSTTNNIHCLNQLAYLVYHHANGERSPEQIAERIVTLDGLTCTVEAVELALEQLAECRLVEYAAPEVNPTQQLQRREALQKLAAMMALPAVMSLMARPSEAACYETSVIDDRSGPFFSSFTFNIRLTCDDSPPS